MELKTGLLKQIELTEGQKVALDMMLKLKASRGAVGVLTGWAGTGKSTMLRVAREALGELTVVTPTGKAAVRVTEAAGLPASTIHRWLYKPVPKHNGEVEWTLKKAEDFHVPESGILVIDEASMVNRELWDDICTITDELDLNVLCVGDPFQLPPVSQDKDDFSLLKPTFKHLSAHLTEIMRQALNSPIIRASMMVREGRWLDAIFELPRIKSADLYQKAESVLKEDGVVIVHSNASRHRVNTEVRKLKGYGASVMPGEPLLVTRNNYDLQIFNGETARFDGWEYVSERTYDIYDPYTKETYQSSFGRAMVDGREVRMAVAEIYGSLDKCQLSSIERVAERNVVGKAPFLHANFGYCLTCHKAQGGEFPEVIVCAEPTVNYDLTEGQRHLYTAITRAALRVSVHWGKLP